MRHLRLVATLLLAFAGMTHAAEIKSPSAFLGLSIGADRTLADYRQMRSYFAALDEASDRIVVETLGETTLGEPMISVVISSEENIANLDRYREIAKKLDDPRGLTKEQQDALVRDGKAIVLVTCNIHSSEIASSQMSMEWAHALASAEDEETKRRLDNVILLLIPSLNPDGQIMETEWYRKYVGTKYEGGNMPWLYHHYVGHDNNRDWFMLTQKETRNLSKLLYHDWFPQVFVDEHQMGSTGPRMFIPPFSDPVDPDVHPLIWREVNIIGANMALRLEQAEKSGLIYGYRFDSYWMGGTRNTGWWKNMTGLLLEVASAKMATPIYVDPNELRSSAKGLPDYDTRINHPNPWKGGWWHLRDIMDYERIASDALHETAADRREDLLRNKLVRANAATAEAEPREAYLIPGAQRNRPTAKRLAELLADHGIEVVIGERDDYWIPLAQPYSRFVREVLEPQRYPETRLSTSGDILAPYDVTTWTLPLMMGVDVQKTRIPAVLIGGPKVAPWFARQAPDTTGAREASGWAVENTSPEVARVVNAALKGKGVVRVGLEPEPDIVQAPVPVTFSKGTFYLDGTAAAAARAAAAEAGVSLIPLAKEPKSGKVQKMPRIGLYKPWRASMDEGWTRWVFDTFGFNSTSLDNNAVKKGKLNDKYDVIVLPSVANSTIAKGQSDRIGYQIELPDQYKGGLGEPGKAAIVKFVEDGGTLVALAESSEWVIKEFNIPVRNVLADEKSAEYNVPGSLLRLEIDTEHPLGWGMPEQTAAFVQDRVAFQTEIPAADIERHIVARFPDDERDILLSGWALGTEKLERRAAVVEMTYGKGRIILFAFPPQHRGQTHATLPMLFNALYWSAR